MATQRDNPYGAFNYLVALGGDQGDGSEGTIVGGFSDVSGLGNEVNYSDSSLSYSCTTPLPPNGTGNFTKAPLFVSQAGGNLRLQSNSPCINAETRASRRPRGSARKISGR